jgi:hypothetical protein
MDVINKTMEPVDKIFVRNVYPVVADPQVGAVISFLILLNIIYGAEYIPPAIKNFIVSPLVRTVIIFALAYRIYANVTQAAVATAVVVILIMVLEKFRKEIYVLAEKFKIISPGPDVYPGCVDITVKDLLLLFDGDEMKLRGAMEKFGIPYDLDLNDTNAPIIATYFINFGHRITDTCTAPS